MYGVNSRELIGSGSLRFPTPMVENSSAELLPQDSHLKFNITRVTFEIYTLAKSRSVRGASHQPAFMDRCLLLTRVWPAYLVDELSWVFYKKLLDRVAYGILSNINDSGATLGKFVERL